ncbi:MAG: hypothetical protein ACRBN8_19910 [Nannocystales bacterium]
MSGSNPTRAEPQPLLERAIDAIRQSVHPGATSRKVEINWDAKSERYEVEVFGSDRCCYAAAPTLELALLAAGKLGDLDSVAVDDTGNAVCLECGGKTPNACAHCSGTGRDPEPPCNWPTGGVLS